MDDRTPRRGNKITLSADQLDRNASMARNLNRRANNCLKLRKGSLEGHRSTNLYSLNYEMRRIKHELKEITHTSGHLELSETITAGAVQGKGAETTKRNRAKRPPSLKSSKEIQYSKDLLSTGDFGGGGHVNSQKRTTRNDNSNSPRRKSLSLPTLPSVLDSAEFRKQSDLSRVDGLVEETVPASFTTKPKLFNKRNSLRNLRSGDTTSPAVVPARKISVSVTNVNGETEDKLGPTTKGAQKNDSSIANLDIEAVKDRIQNRLSQPVDEDSDIIPYMHVPPDGLPRTVYLLPPLNDLLDEAKNARYIRRPKKPLQELEPDDPDRELDIDEIFSKKR